MGRPKLYRVPNHRHLRRDTPEAEAESIYWGDFSIGEGVGRRRFKPKLGRGLKQSIAKLSILMEQAREQHADGFSARGPHKLSEVQKAHLKVHASRLRPRTVEASRQGDRNALEGLGDPYIQRLKRDQIEEWIESRIQEVNPATVNRELTRLKQVLKWAVDKGWLRKSPAARVKKFRGPEGRIRWLTDEEEAALKKAATEEEWDLVRFAFLTGMRQGEQLGLTWKNIKGDIIVLEAESTKTHRRRTIPIGKTVAEILARQKGESEMFVFPSPTGWTWEANNFRRRVWRPLFDRAGLEDFTWHDLRHTFCSRLVMAGASLANVRELAGHRSFEMTLKYSHLAPSHLRDAIDLLE